MYRIHSKIRQALIVFLFFPFILSAQDEDLRFPSGDVHLSGTLLKPKTNGPFPLVIFIHGSGAEERSNSKQRAKEFVKNGIAAFIYDKRGVGKSEGEKDFHQYYSFDILAQDANAAVAFLSKRSDIKSDKIGYVAASQGGWVAPLAASTHKNIAFMIIISGSVSTPGEDNLFERNARLKTEGFSDKDIQEVTEMHLLDQEVSRSGERFAEFKNMWEKYKNSAWFKRVYLSHEPSSPESKYRQWYRKVVDINPLDHLKELNIPILWLYGDSTLDRYCPVDLSVYRLTELKKSGKDYEIRIEPGANHSLQLKSKDLAIQKSVFDWLSLKL